MTEKNIFHIADFEIDLSRSIVIKGVCSQSVDIRGL